MEGDGRREGSEREGMEVEGEEGEGVHCVAATEELAEGVHDGELGRGEGGEAVCELHIRHRPHVEQLVPAPAPTAPRPREVCQSMRTPSATTDDPALMKKLLKLKSDGDCASTLRDSRDRKRS